MRWPFTAASWCWSLPSVMGESCLMADLQVAPWTLVIPVKRTAIAKSRLAAAYPQHRPELARAFAVDTTAAALSSRPGPGGSGRHRRPGGRSGRHGDRGPRRTGSAGCGLNGALGARRSGCRGASTQRHGVAALSADLPALRPTELTAALAACVAARIFVIDQPGTGTTMLAAAPGVAAGSPLRCRFRASSPGFRRSTDRLTVLESLRRDVDTAADLAHAVQLGVGPRTADVMSLVIGAATGTEGLAC